MNLHQKNRKTILVIEDDQNVLSVIVKHLTYTGYNVDTAADGMEGLKRLKQGGFDLVITDIVMPYVSGIGLVNLVKDDSPLIPVIAITGFGKESEAAALEKKADLVLAKPIKMAVLKDYVVRLLEESEETAPP